jgi:hypothetical protein
VAWAALATGSAAQQTQDQVVNRQLAYDAAKSQYQAALDAWRVVEKQWNDAVEEHEQARRAGDGERQNAALIRALDRSRELDRLERRVADQRSTLDGARAALLAALDDRMERVADQLAAARTTGDRARFGALLRDLQNQQSQIEADRDGPAVRVQVVYYPSIQFDPRDTPETMVAKAQLLRSKAEQADSSLAQIDREIERLERQLRRSRNVQSLVSGVERFGDVQPPVGAPSRRNPPADVRARPDSAGVSRPEPTPQQRLQQLQLLRLQLLDAKRQFLERAGTFETRARRIG